MQCKWTLIKKADKDGTRTQKVVFEANIAVSTWGQIPPRYFRLKKNSWTCIQKTQTFRIWGKMIYDMKPISLLAWHLTTNICLLLQNVFEEKSHKILFLRAKHRWNIWGRVKSFERLLFCQRLLLVAFDLLFCPLGPSFGWTTSFEKTVPALLSKTFQQSLRR